MERKSLETMFWLLAWLVVLTVVTIVAGGMTPPPSAREAMPPASFFVCIFSAIGAAVMFGLCMFQADALRNAAPPETFQWKNEIPQDAVDRRWLKELESAFNDQAYQYQISSSADPLERANWEADRNSRQEKFRAIIRAAKSARGVRLPAVMTMRDD